MPDILPSHHDNELAALQRHNWGCPPAFTRTAGCRSLVWSERCTIVCAKDWTMLLTPCALPPPVPGAVHQISAHPSESLPHLSDKRGHLVLWLCHLLQSAYPAAESKYTCSNAEAWSEYKPEATVLQHFGETPKYGASWSSSFSYAAPSTCQ